MNINTKRTFRDRIRFVGSLLFIWLYIPHIIVYCLTDRHAINSDIQQVMHQIKTGFRLNHLFALVYLLHNNKYFRSLFYYRVGPVAALLIGWWRRGAADFIIPYSTKIGKGMWFAHPYATILNAESIGDNFHCIHCTTLGTKAGMNGEGGMRPVIGNNVSVGCHVCIIGPVHIGNNVTIGAGSVVISDVPDNCIVAGNPARIIKTIEKNG